MKKKIKKQKPYVIIRAYTAGVFAGYLKYQSPDGTRVTLDACRRIWYWKGAASISQLAKEGVSCPAECKFSVPVDGHEILNVIEVIPTTKKAKQIIQAVSEWKA